MEGLNVYRVTIYRRTSRSGQPLEPLEKVVSSDLDIHGIREWFRKRYDGFTVDISPVERLERLDTGAPWEELEKKEPTRGSTWITGCRLFGGEVAPELSEAIKAYDAAKDAADKAREGVNAAVRAIEKAKHLVREVDLTDMRINTSGHGSVNNIKLMLEGDFLEELQGKEEGS